MSWNKNTVVLTDQFETIESWVYAIVTGNGLNDSTNDMYLLRTNGKQAEVIRRDPDCDADDHIVIEDNPVFCDEEIQADLNNKIGGWIVTNGKQISIRLQTDEDVAIQECKRLSLKYPAQKFSVVYLSPEELVKHIRFCQFAYNPLT